jgi:hypothetical protein
MDVGRVFPAACLHPHQRRRFDFHARALAALVAMPPLASPHRDVLHPGVGWSGESGRDWVRVRPVDRPSTRVPVLGEHVRKLLQHMGGAGGAAGTQDLVVRSLTRSLDVSLDGRVLLPFDSDVHARSSIPLDLGAATDSQGSCPKGPCLLYLLTAPSSYGLLAPTHVARQSAFCMGRAYGYLFACFRLVVQKIVSRAAYVDVAYCNARRQGALYRFPRATSGWSQVRSVCSAVCCFNLWRRPAGSLKAVQSHRESLTISHTLAAAVGPKLVPVAGFSAGRRLMSSSTLSAAMQSGVYKLPIELK